MLAEHIVKEELRKLCINFGRQLSAEQITLIYAFVEDWTESAFRERIRELMDAEQFPKNLRVAFSAAPKLQVERCEWRLRKGERRCLHPGIACPHPHGRGPWFCPWHALCDQWGRVDHDNLHEFRTWWRNLQRVYPEKVAGLDGDNWFAQTQGFDKFIEWIAHAEQIFYEMSQDEDAREPGCDDE